MSNKYVHIFISYSHKDESFKDELNAHISPLCREGDVRVWYDRRIKAGDVWESEIATRLEQADIVLLLISPDFFASDYCYTKELGRALEKHRSGAAIVLPVIVRPVDWMHSKLASIQALPIDAIPISLSDNHDLAWTGVVAGIRDACNRVTRQRDITNSSKVSQTYSLTSVLADVIDDVEVLYNKEEPFPISGITTGLHDLDVLTDGLHVGEITVIASAPSIDRAGLLLKMAAHVAIDLRLPVALVCSHLDKKYLASRILTSTSHIPVGRVRRGTLRDSDWERMSLGIGKAHEAPLELVPAVGTTVDDVVIALDRIAERRGALPLVVIDSIDHFSEDKATVIRKLREYVRHRQRAVVAGIGLESDPSERNDPRPRIQDIGRWATINEDIDCLMLLYVDEIYHPETKDVGVTEVIVTRARTGGVGTVRVAYLAESQSYENLASDE